MTDEQVVLKTADLYADICRNSFYGKHRGMKISDIRKKYKLAKRDVVTLLRFLNQCLDRINEVDSMYILYGVTEKQKEKDKIELTNYDDIEEDGKDWNINNFDDDCYIVIEDNISMLQEKVKEDNIDITNVSLLSKLSSDALFQKVWNQVSQVSLGEDYIIDKGQNDFDTNMFEEKKRNWIHAILKSNYVWAKAIYWKKAQKLFPLGLYYDRVTKFYVCVYCKDNDTKMNEIRLSEVEEIEVCEDDGKKNESLNAIKLQFNIYEYIKSIQTENMKLKVYNEGNVINKLKELLRDNQCEINEYEGYALFSFKTDDPDEYLKVLNGYGRSVVVLKPERLRDDVIEMIDTTLEKYEKIMHE